MLVVGNMFGMLPAMAVPNKDDLGLDLSLVGKFLTPFGCALGIWVVGNIGRWKGSLSRPLLGCYLTLPAYLYGMNIVSWTTIIGKKLIYCNNWGIAMENFTRMLLISIFSLLFADIFPYLSSPSNKKTS